MQGQKRERVIREKKKEEKICTKPDCVARRETFAEMNNENEYLRVKVRELCCVESPSKVIDFLISSIVVNCS